MPGYIPVDTPPGTKPLPLGSALPAKVGGGTPAPPGGSRPSVKKRKPAARVASRPPMGKR